MSETWANGLGSPPRRVRNPGALREAGGRAPRRDQGSGFAWPRAAPAAVLPRRWLGLISASPCNTVAEVFHTQADRRGAGSPLRSGSGTTVAPRCAAARPTPVPEAARGGRASALRPVAGGARPVRVPARRVADGGAQGDRRRPRRGVRLRGTRAGLPPLRGGAGGVPRPHPRRVVTAPGGENMLPVICSGFAHGAGGGSSRALRRAAAWRARWRWRSTAIRVHTRHHHPAGGCNAPGCSRFDAYAALLRIVDAARRRHDAVLLTPAHQFPLGMTLAPDRRRSFAEWDGIVIEDDYDGEFRYDRQPVGAMRRRSRRTEVIYCWDGEQELLRAVPGVRLAWLVVPAVAARRGVRTALPQAAGPRRLDQLTLAEFITSGAYDRSGSDPPRPAGLPAPPRPADLGP